MTYREFDDYLDNKIYNHNKASDIAKREPVKMYHQIKAIAYKDVRHEWKKNFAVGKRFIDEL